jgi:hypothetical protein
MKFKAIYIQSKPILLILFSLFFMGRTQGQSPCGAGQQYITAGHFASTPANPLTSAGTLPVGNYVTTTRTDNVLGGGLASYQVNYTAGAVYNNPTNVIAGGGYIDYGVYNGGEITVVYNFSTPVTDPIIVVAGVYGLYPGNVLSFPGQTVTKVTGSAGFVLTGNTATVPGVIGAQYALLKLSGSISTFTMTLKATAGAVWNAAPSIGVGGCFTPPTNPCPGSSFESVVGQGVSSNPTDGLAGHMTLDLANSVDITRTDVTPGTLPSAQWNFYSGADAIAAPAFITGTNFLNVNSGGYNDFYVYSNGTTDVTYTFCKPVTDPYVFFGYLGMDAGASAEFLGKTVTMIEAESGIVLQGGNKVVAISGIDQNSYLKINGTMTSFTVRLKDNTPWGYQLFSMVVGKCKQAVSCGLY